MNTTTPFKFSVGQKVIFINEYGVNFGERTITAREVSEIRGKVYGMTPTDCPWFKSKESSFFAIDDAEGISKATRVKRMRYIEPICADKIVIGKCEVVKGMIRKLHYISRW